MSLWVQSQVMVRIFYCLRTMTGMQLRRIYINNCIIEERGILPLSSLHREKGKGGNLLLHPPDAQAPHPGKGLRPLHSCFLSGKRRIEGPAYARRSSEEPSTYRWGLSSGAGDYIQPNADYLHCVQS